VILVHFLLFTSLLYTSLNSTINFRYSMMDKITKSMLRFEYRMKLFAIKNLRFKHHFTLPQDKALPLSIAVFVFISFSTIVTLNQVQKRQITESQAQASIDNQPGGACDLSVNKGCGGAGGCRHWEYCNDLLPASIPQVEGHNLQALMPVEMQHLPQLNLPPHRT